MRNKPLALILAVAGLLAALSGCQYDDMGPTHGPALYSQYAGTGPCPVYMPDSPSDRC
jgi:hypothetical protein